MTAQTTPSARRTGLVSRALATFSVPAMVSLLAISAVASSAYTYLVSRVAEADVREARLALRDARARIEADLLPETEGADPQSWGQRFVAEHDGYHQAVAGLQPMEGEDSVLFVDVIVDETRTDAELETQLGLPCDLDGDGQIATPDVSNHAQLLPVVLTVRWQGVSGPRVLKEAFFAMGF